MSVVVHYTVLLYPSIFSIEVKAIWDTSEHLVKGGVRYHILLIEFIINSLKNKVCVSKGKKSLKQKFEKRMKLRLLQRNAAIRTTCFTHVRSRPRLLGYKISVDVKNIFNLVRQKNTVCLVFWYIWNNPNLSLGSIITFLVLYQKFMSSWKRIISEVKLRLTSVLNWVK